MRIAVDASILELPCPTGVERAAAEMVRALVGALQRRDELIVFGRERAPLPGVRSRQVRAVLLGGSEPLAVWREARLSAALPNQGADVCWSPVAAIPMRAKVPCVATVHEVPWLVRVGMEGRLRERVHRIRLGAAARSAARIAVPSETTAAQVAELHPTAAARVRIVPHGVPARFLEPQDVAAARRLLRVREVPGAPFLLHVGGTRARKNVPLLLRAFARYRLQGGRATLVLAGPGPAPSLPAGVLHLGYVADDLLVALYDAATALVVSSESEGFGLPVLEAMARGLPVLSTPCAAIAETAAGAALLLESEDEDVFARGLLRVVRDEALRSDLVARGRARAAEATWERSARRLREVLAEASDRS